MGSKKKWGFTALCSALLATQVLSGAGSLAEGDVHGPVEADLVHDHAEHEFFDVRNALAPVLPTDLQLDAAGKLLSGAGTGIRIEWDYKFGTPATITREKGYVSGPTSGDAVTVAKNWLKQNAALFGMTEADVDALNVTRNYEMEGTGLRPVTFQQTFNGLESAFGGRIIVAVAKDGSILSVASNARPSGALAADFALSSADALQRVISLHTPDITYIPDATGTKNGWEVFAGGTTFPADQYVKKAVFLRNDEIRPAYRVLFIEELNEAFEVVVDGVTGETLYQRSLVQYLEPHGLVFENYPGAPAGGTQVVRSFAGDPKSSPEGWTFPAGDLGITTLGNNADSYANWSNFLVPEGGPVRPVDALGQFNYTFFDSWKKTNGATVPPSYAEDMQSAVTNLFYHHNLFHDYYYNLGWVEAAGNLQVNNFNKGGMGGDPILGMAHAGAVSGGAPTYTGRDNAYMLTLPDGIASWSGMFLWEPIPAAFEGVYADGDFDASVIYHEYTHALTNRLVAGGEALGSFQAGSMGEGWSDWFAMHYLMAKGLETEPVVGKYVTGNEERGIRSWSLSEAPLNYGDVGYDIIGPEVHADGDIWAAILWHVREEMIQTLGPTEGQKVIEQLVVDAMPISRPDPSFADMRTAIIAADVLRYNGAHYDLLWNAFAQRGLGLNAKSLGGDDTDPFPAYNHPVAAMNGQLTATVIHSGTGEPVTDAKITVGQFEARVSASAKTSELGGFSMPMVGGTYDITIQAKGFGSRTIEDVQIVAGKNKKMLIKLAPNMASRFNGASVLNVSSQSDANPIKNALDDTEASVYATEDTGADFQGAEFIVALAGDQAVPISEIQVSAFKDISKARFSTLKDFEVQASIDGSTWTTIVADTFTAQKPRPTTPDLHYKTWVLDTPVKAHLLKFIAKNAQADTANYIQVAEVQVFSQKKSKVEPMEIAPLPPFVAEGLVAAGNPGTGIGSLAGVAATLAVTENEFVTTGNPQPVTQGVDGFVVTIPADYADGLANFSLEGTGSSYDYDVYFYDKNFALIGGVATAGANESGIVPGGTRYVYVGLYTGVDIPFKLTLTSSN